MKTKKFGISLIVLVITIIVMIILASAIIITLANNGIIGRANTAKDNMTEAQIREAAQLAWADLYLGGGQITGELIKQRLEASGISKAELDKYKITADENGVTVELIGNSKPSGELNENGFYYNMLYTGTRTSYDETFNIGLVFLEDNKAIGFIKASDLAKIRGIEATLTPDKYVIMPDAGVMTVTYEDSTVISLDPSTGDEIGKITFSENGTKATVEVDASGLLPTGTVLTLDKNQGIAHSIYFGAEYYVESEKEGQIVSIPTIFDENGSMKLNGEITIPEGALEWHVGNYAAVFEENPALLVSFDGNVVYILGQNASDPAIQVGIRITHSGIIPEGGTYYVGVTSFTVGDYSDATAILNAGEPFPETISEGDVYVYGDYEYRQLVSSIKSNYEDILGVTFDNGWFVTALDKTKPYYTMALGSVNNRLATNFLGTYENNTVLTEAPAIPSSAVNMTNAFNGCTKLTYVSEIPSNVTCLSQTFLGCAALEEMPDLRNAKSLTDMYAAFWLSGIVEVPDISYLTKVTNLSAAFNECENLIKVGKLPPNVVNMSTTFYGCKNLKAAPDFSNLTKLEDLSNVFEGCVLLESAPVIPASVKDMSEAFQDCIALVTPPEMANAVNLETLEDTFSGCKLLKTAPELKNSTKLTNMFRTFKNCENLVKAPVIPPAVENMHETFAHCKALTTATTIPASVTSMVWTFLECENLTGTIEINVTDSAELSRVFMSTVKPITITGAAAQSQSVREKLSNYGYDTNITFR